MKPFLQVALLLATVIAASKAAGAVSKRFGQPAVFGELLMGLILGPSLVNFLHWPIFAGAPELALAGGGHAGYLEWVIKHLAELGVIFLMFLAGLETDLGEMRKVGAAAFLGATGGVFLPMAAGVAISMAFGYSGFESVFIGTILTATSVSISAQTLMELGKLRSKEGTTILGAAVIDDVMGIIVLSLVVALHGAGGGEGGGSIWLIVVKMAGYFAAAIAAGKYLVPPLIEWARRLPGTEVAFAATLVLGLVYAVTAEALGGVAAITGSYLLGVMIAQRHDLKHMVEEKLNVLAYGFFVPIFFVSIGLEADLSQVTGGQELVYMGLIILFAIITKIIGAGLGVRPFRFTWGEATRVGIGMVSRGEVALIVAGIGLEAGVIDEGIFSIMVVMTLVTTLITPVLLRLSFRDGGPARPAAPAARAQQ